METVRSALTSLDGDRLRYRGHDAVELSRTRTFEAVARLLWTGGPVDDLAAGPFEVEETAAARVRSVLAALPAGTRLTDRLRVAVSASAAAGPTPPRSPAGAGRLLGTLVASLVPPAPPQPAAATVAQLLGTAGGPWLERALVLLADHGLAVSTVAARVAASARAPLPSVLAAALGAADGPLHAAAGPRAHRLLRQAVHDPRAPALAALVEGRRAGGGWPGFGHVVYVASDPRAGELLDLLPPGPRGEAVAEVVGRLTEAVVRAGGAGAFPNVDLALAALTLAHRLPAQSAEFLFELARTAGWTAHALEEYRAPGLRFRVRGLQDP